MPLRKVDDQGTPAAQVYRDTVEKYVKLRELDAVYDLMMVMLWQLAAALFLLVEWKMVRALVSRSKRQKGRSGVINNYRVQPCLGSIKKEILYYKS
jgi:hypothetical protein